MVKRIVWMRTFTPNRDLSRVVRRSRGSESPYTVHDIGLFPVGDNGAARLVQQGKEEVGTGGYVGI